MTDIVGTCVNCPKKVSQKVADFSQKKFGKMLCFDCQKKEVVRKANPVSNTTSGNSLKDLRITRLACLNTAVETFKLKESTNVTVDSVKQVAQLYFEWATQD